MSTNTDALRNAVAHWNAGDLDRYLQLYDPAIRLHGYSPEPMNREAVDGFYRYGIWGAFPRCRLTLHDVLEDGDKVVARFTLSGRHEGDFMGVPATGKDISLDGITILQMREGKCIERWSCADMLGVLQQIGAVPAAA